jgi:hypothetical protein
VVRWITHAGVATQVGVADGVGGWAEQGVDPGKYSKVCAYARILPHIYGASVSPGREGRRKDGGGEARYICNVARVGIDAGCS